MKTLIVSYLPRGEMSHTRKLLKTFAQTLGGHEFEHVNLIEDVPDLFTPGNLGAYIQRNYLKKRLTPELSRSLARMDRMTAQFKTADIVVLATPMFNFSLPATVKAWFDAVMLKGETWDINEQGYVGLMKGKKVLILMASGGVYTGEMASWDHCMSLAKLEFQFMGFDDIRGVSAAGVNKFPDEIDEIISKAQEEIRSIVSEWYPAE